CVLCHDSICLFAFFFFFQAEDGIRDRNVTGVQTCALPIFWPLTETQITPPSVEEWIDACEQLLGKSADESKSQKAAREAGQASMFDVGNWAELNEVESNQRALSGAAARVETVLDTHPWLRVTERIAEQQSFFHWDLDFATVFDQG